MSTPLQVVITDVGYAALVSEQNDGTNALRIAQVALGDGSTPADASATALANEHTRLDSIAGEVADAATIHVTARDETDATYTVREFGLITDDGTLFAIYAQPDAIVEKAAGSVMLLPIDVRFVDVDVSSITFGSVDFVNPPATEVTRGVIERADEGEAQAGEDNERAMSPLRVFQAIKSFFGGATGAGAGKGLDADKLDGEHGAYYRDLQNATGNLPRARASGTYDINVSGKANTAGNADQFGGREPSYYRDAAHLTGTAPRNVLPPATTDAAGAVERATDAEASAGDDPTRYITPAHLKNALNSTLEAIFPVGSVYTNTTDGNTNPGSFLPGSWRRIKEGFLYPQGAPDSGGAGSTGGKTEVRLSAAQNGNHSHGIRSFSAQSPAGGTDNDFHYESGGNYISLGKIDSTYASGNGAPHENMPPYLTVYMWQRVA